MTERVVFGSRGLVGSAIVRALRATPGGIIDPARRQLDLRDKQSVWDFMHAWQPNEVYLAAATVGGIQANIDRPGDFIADNLRIQTNVIEACMLYGAKLCFLGSSCIYPRDCPQPMREVDLMTGPLEETNRSYAIAKLAGIEMVRAFSKQHGLRAVCLIPPNLYGPNDNFGEEGHMVPMLIERFEQARGVLADAPEVVVWGTGTPRRELMHVDDLAAACVHFMAVHEDPEPINVGTEAEYSVGYIAKTIADVVGFKGEIRFDSSKPDGMPRKLMSSTKAYSLGWRPTISLVEGLHRTVAWYREP